MKSGERATVDNAYSVRSHFDLRRGLKYLWLG
jgi:hypothetical protein